MRDTIKNGCIKNNSLVLIGSRRNYNHYGLTGTLELLKAMHKKEHNNGKLLQDTGKVV